MTEIANAPEGAHHANGANHIADDAPRQQRRRLDGLLGGGAKRLRGKTPLPVEELVLSVLIPVYNEKDTIEVILEQVESVPVRKEIICVDDCSTDGTREILARLEAEGRIHRLIFQPHNRGKIYYRMVDLLSLTK